MWFIIIMVNFVKITGFVYGIQLFINVHLNKIIS